MKLAITFWAFDMQFSLVQWLSRVQLFVTPWTAARQVSLSITNSQSLLRFMCIESMMLSNHLIFCCPLLLLPLIFPSIGVFSNESVLRIMVCRSIVYFSGRIKIWKHIFYLIPLLLKISAVVSQRPLKLRCHPTTHNSLHHQAAAYLTTRNSYHSASSSLWWSLIA